MSRAVHAFVLLTSCALGVSPAAAQQNLSGFNISAERQERIGENHWRLSGSVELEQDDTKVYADVVEVFVAEDRAVATGNVTFSQGRSQISADRADLNIESETGTFYGAWGIADMQPQARSAGGPPPLAGQETDMYFFGEVIEKIGPKKYRITKGGFSTCVQPTPRWELTAGTVVLNVDDYTLLRNAVFSVKGVPLLYLPILYYPTNDEGRATGFLIPTYGTSTLRGQNISNAFFWAIDRSQDATIMHDWFSTAGQGLGSEYRYNLGAGDGTLKAYMLTQKQATYTQSGGGTGTLPASRTFEIQGSANQRLPGNLRARARANYFSSLTTMQTFNTNVYEASRNQRSYGANAVGGWGVYSLNATYDWSENFYDSANSVVSGSAPRISLSRNERPIVRGSPLYFSAGGEVARFQRESRTPTQVVDSGLVRVDVTPRLRYPFKRWQWFTVNSSLSWRETFYTRSRGAPGDIGPAPIGDANLNRQYFTFIAQAVGPVLNRIWDAPGNGYADRFKHSIEPFLSLQRTSAIDNFDRIVYTDGVDSVVGGATSYTYGVNNRLYARRRRTGRAAQAQEIANVENKQSYYSDTRSAQFDRDYSTGIGGAPSHFSPVSIRVRATPAADFDATLQAEIDSRHLELRTLSVSSGYTWEGLQTTVGWSKRYFIAELPGFNDPNGLTHSLNVSTNGRTRNNRIGGAYAFNYDVLREVMLQQRISAFYNAQCCGIAFEFQTFSFPRGFAPVASDHRFFLSFTLAGLGNFSPFNGAMGAVPR